MPSFGNSYPPSARAVFLRFVDSTSKTANLSYSSYIREGS
jgi:hypothetical protein